MTVHIDSISIRAKAIVIRNSEDGLPEVMRKEYDSYGASQWVSDRRSSAAHRTETTFNIIGNTIPGDLLHVEEPDPAAKVERIYLDGFIEFWERKAEEPWDSAALVPRAARCVAQVGSALRDLLELHVMDDRGKCAVCKPAHEFWEEPDGSKEIVCRMVSHARELGIWLGEGGADNA